MKTACCIAVLVLSLLSRALPAAEPVPQQGLSNPLYALCISTHDPKYRTPADQAKLLKEVGYAGMAHLWADGVPESLKAADDNGLKLYQIYIAASVDPKRPKYDPKLKEVLPLLKGRETMIGLIMGGGRPSDTAQDARAVEIVREIADLAAQSDVRIALYPHAGDWLERVEDAVRIGTKSQRKNVGATFNLCHFLKVDDEKNLEPALRAAAPHLFAVTICGADSGAKGAGWDRLLQTLDRGTFDNVRTLKTLKEIGYTGPIGQQCFGIKGDVRDNLKRSIEAWKGLSARAAGALTKSGAGTLVLTGENTYSGGTVPGIDAGAILKALPNPFFAFDNGTGRGRLSPEAQAKMLKELGYEGIGYSGTRDIPAMLKALDAEGLKMFNIYVGAHLGPGGPKYEPGLEQAIEQLKGRGTLLWLHLPGNPPNGDEQAVAAVRHVAALAEKSGLPVALYPHHGFYVAKVSDAVRVAKKVDRKNVGVTINLCHWLKEGDSRNVEVMIREALPHLFVASINGADAGDTAKMGWDRLIQTLDRGSYDVYGFVKTLRSMGYTGPIGLQCFAVKGDTRENLTRSMDSWRQFRVKLAAEK